MNSKNVDDEDKEYLTFLTSLETCSAQGSPNQPHLTPRIRTIVINWMSQVVYRFKCNKEVIHLAVHIFDRYLECTHVPRTKLQIIGATACFIASKIEDVYAPYIDDIVYIANNSYTRADVLDVEVRILKALDHRLLVPYACSFCRLYKHAANLDHTGDMHMLDYLCELQLLYNNMRQYKASNVAAAAVYLVRRLRRVKTAWPEAMVHLTGYTLGKLLPCARDILWILRQDDTCDNVKKKFRSNCYGRVALTSFANIHIL